MPCKVTCPQVRASGSGRHWAGGVIRPTPEAVPGSVLRPRALARVGGQGAAAEGGGLRRAREGVSSRRPGSPRERGVRGQAERILRPWTRVLSSRRGQPGAHEGPTPRLSGASSGTSTCPGCRGISVGHSVPRDSGTPGQDAVSLHVPVCVRPRPTPRGAAEGRLAPQRGARGAGLQGHASATARAGRGWGRAAPPGSPPPRAVWTPRSCGPPASSCANTAAPKDQSILSTALCLATQADWILDTSVLIPWLPQKPVLCPHSLNRYLFAKRNQPPLPEARTLRLPSG